MGKNRKGFNWRARQPAEATQCGSTLPPKRPGTAESELLMANQTSSSAADSNPLILPSKKPEKSSKKHVNLPKVKFVSKRQKKMQERLKEKRIKSSKRGDLIAAIQSVKASDDEMKQYMSITQMQTKGLKRHFESVRRAEKNLKRPKISDEVSNDNGVSVEEFVDSSSEDEGPHSQIHPTPGAVQNSSANNETSAVKNQPVKAIPVEENLGSASSDVIPTIPNPFRRLQNVAVQRLPEVQESRSKLPITSEEQSVMEAINDNPIIIICGETGSGKTTQVPQFLYEAGYASGSGIIGITEPRRVAAISMSKRVGMELHKAHEVSFQIRYEKNVNSKTRIKFMTDGVLMREIASDFLLKSYSVIILDEAHERSVYTDILIGMLSRIVPLRQKRGIPLKLIIMSATLRVEDFTCNRQLFPTVPPVINIDSRQFPVTVHFNRCTPKEGAYLQEAFRKISKIHRELPPGGILVFVTGQQEVHALCRRLRQTFPAREIQDKEELDETVEKAIADATRKTQLPPFRLDAYPVTAIDEEEGKAEDEADDDYDMEKTVRDSASNDPMFVLPLYSLLPTEKQALVFQPPPAGSRLCVVATNVAETSLTIPDIKYVVDCGKMKIKLYDQNTGMSKFDVKWTSKASANQRAGRAGRTSAGHCYRLYSSAVFNDDDKFPQFIPPEITRRLIDDLVLQIKALSIEKIANFPFPTPPSTEALMVAEEELLQLGAIEGIEKSGRKVNPLLGVSRITAVGETMIRFPVAPRFAKMLALCGENNLMPYMITIIAALTVREPLSEGRPEDIEKDDLTEVAQERQRFLGQLKRRWIGSGYSMMLGDLMVLLKAVGSAEFAGLNKDYCDQHGLQYKAMREIRQLRQQLTNAINLAVPGINIVLDPGLSPPSALQCKLLLQIILCCMGRKIARKVPAEVVAAAATVAEKAFLRHAYQTTTLEQLVYLHPRSVLFREEPEYVLYQELFEVKNNKIYCRNVVAIEPAWIAMFQPCACIFTAPLETPEVRYDDKKGKVVCHRGSTFGPRAWPLPPVETEYPVSPDLYKLFGMFFLEGLVCTKLSSFVLHLLVKPVVMVKSWAALQTQTQTMLLALARENVTTRSSLLQAWQKDPTYLLEEYLQWLPAAYHSEVKILWPPRQNKT